MTRFGRLSLLLRELKPENARKESAMPGETACEQVLSPPPLSIEALEEEARAEYLAGKTEPMGFEADAAVSAGN